MVSLGACNPARGVPIFLWHSVGEGGPVDPLDVPPAEFDAELRMMERWGAHPITLDQLFDARDGKGQLPPRPVVLTFDDGRQCLDRAALPVLQAHHMVAEVFVITGLLAEFDGSRRSLKDDTGDHLELIWPEVLQMQQSGAFVVESHAVDHKDLASLSEAEQLAQARDSRAALRARLDTPVDFFAYPFGAFDGATERAAEAAGYRGAVAVQKGLGSRFAMLRVSVHRGYPQVVEDALRRAFGEPVSP